MSSPKETRLRLALADAALSVYLGVTREPPISEEDLQHRLRAEQAAARELLAVTREMDKRIAPTPAPPRKKPGPSGTKCNSCGGRVDKSRRTCRECVAVINGKKPQ